jgi:hypothetical protein
MITSKKVADLLPRNKERSTVTL